jgi:cyclopropane fatty-acyl-phospholipid synthase-like methyltransferase
MLWLFIIFLTFVVLVLGLFSVYGLFAVISGAPFVPTSKRRLKKMISLAEIKKTDTVMDVGCGDGRLVVAAAKLAKQAVGIEINPVLVWVSKFRVARLNNAEIRAENLWKTDFSNVDIVMLYFIPEKMKKLENKIRNEMKPGSRIISHAFTFPDWPYEKKDGKVYLYKL